eukprot:gnl/MRDRNA2_/MRDRNA2_78836_c0_seq1.p1 gnl/MRDRNA2_/MRDRNA2_78836_c0~~gnl/MRDRNA2_/MRDRNA2_78836_c0_seq1.p1  ORF type:complete len:296 (+),score=74.86 gnl/MRDRNA2_/MRDRNA2_78836_c0_seq1:60-890(+)
MDVQPQTAFIGVFMFMGTYFALNLIASQLEGPFGDDPNDLQGAVAQKMMNDSLLLLMKPACFKSPGFAPKALTPASTGASPKGEEGLALKRLSQVFKTAAVMTKLAGDEDNGGHKASEETVIDLSPAGGHGNQKPSMQSPPQSFPETNQASIVPQPSPPERPQATAPGKAAPVMPDSALVGLKRSYTNSKESLVKVTDTQAPHEQQPQQLEPQARAGEYPDAGPQATRKKNKDVSKRSQVEDRQADPINGGDCQPVDEETLPGMPGETTTDRMIAA